MIFLSKVKYPQKTLAELAARGEKRFFGTNI
jgi:hypothetical protein